MGGTCGPGYRYDRRNHPDYRPRSWQPGGRCISGLGWLLGRDNGRVGSKIYHWGRRKVVNEDESIQGNSLYRENCLACITVNTKLGYLY